MSQSATLAALLAALLAAGPAFAQARPATALSGDARRIAGPLSVRQAVEIALRENPAMLAARADAAEAAAGTRSARAMTLPQVSANGYLTSGDMSSMVDSAPDVTPPSARMVPPGGVAIANLTLMAPLYTGGRLRGMVRAAEARERAATAGIGSEAATAALEVKRAYYGALLAAAMADVAGARVTADQEAVANARALLEVGRGIEASVRRAEAELSDAERMLATARNERAAALLNLSAALGASPDSEITLSDSLAFEPPASGLETQIADAARLRPELSAARDRVQAATADLDAARGSLAPQVYALGMADADTRSRGSSERGYTLGLALSLPLFDAGQRRAEVDGARAREGRARAELRAAELRVGTEVRQAWLDVQTGAENYRTAQAAVRAAQEAYDVTALRVRNQKAIQVELLDAIAALTQARTNVAQALYDHALAVARLQRAVGRT
ncbi:MAG: TolC family protein [Chthonomonadales bacterium]|nr:TolC family protein [Chthonomonadales bacterium]